MYYTLFAILLSLSYFRFMFGSSKVLKGSNFNREELMLNRINVGGGPSKYTTPMCDLH